MAFAAPTGAGTLTRDTSEAVAAPASTIAVATVSGWARAAVVLAAAACLPLAPQAADAASSPAALAYLTRIQDAAQRQSYAGTYVHQQGSQVQSSRVVHFLDKSGEHEKLEMLDGQEREFVRNNDDVRCYVPDSKLVLVERRARYDTFPALLTMEPVDIDRFYTLEAMGVERVAGRSAQLIVLKSRDDLRYGYRLWFDRATSLLLKAQTVNGRGATIEQLAFTEIAIGGTIDPSRVRPSAASTDGWRIETNRMVPVDLQRAGWTLAQPVAGFHKVMEVRRAFGGREDIGQMVYSDGLAAISIFIEAVPPQDAQEGNATKGPVNIVMRRHGDFWLTIVGDAPAESVRRMADALVYSPKPDAPKPDAPKADAPKPDAAKADSAKK